MTGGGRHQGVVAYKAPPARESELALAGGRPRTLFLVLDGVTDPHNLGACLRSAKRPGHRGDRAEGWAVGITLTVRRPAGAADCVPFVAATNLARIARAEGRRRWLTGLAGGGEPDPCPRFTGPVAIVMGSEGGACAV